MTTIAHRELRNNSSEILRRVVAGEVFEITNNGLVVAELRPPEGKGLGGIPHRPARLRGGFDQIDLADAPESTQEMLDYLRGDR